MSASKFVLGGYRIVAKQLEPETKTASGIEIPVSAADKEDIAEVIDVGPKVKNIKKGDKVVYKTYSTPIKIEDEEYLFLWADLDDKDGDVVSVYKAGGNK